MLALVYLLSNVSINFIGSNHQSTIWQGTHQPCTCVCVYLMKFSYHQYRLEKLNEDLLFGRKKNLFESTSEKKTKEKYSHRSCHLYWWSIKIRTPRLNLNNLILYTYTRINPSSLFCISLDKYLVITVSIWFVVW